MQQLVSNSFQTYESPIHMGAHPHSQVVEKTLTDVRRGESGVSHHLIPVSQLIPCLHGSKLSVSRLRRLEPASGLCCKSRIPAPYPLRLGSCLSCCPGSNSLGDWVVQSCGLGRSNSTCINMGSWLGAGSANEC